MAALDQDNSLKIGRGTLHGFVSFEMAGYYSAKVVHVDDSFRFMVKGYIEWISRMERGSGD